LNVNLDWAPLLSFILLSAISPGPNNLTCGSMGVLYGYKASFKYLIGVVVGWVVVMFFSGAVAGFMVEFFPSYESILRGIGAAYILWLAYKALKMSYDSNGDDNPPFCFLEGFLMQFLNVKLILFGMTIYASYLLPVTVKFIPLLISAFGLGVRAFIVNSTWVLFGAAIRRFLNRPLVGKIFNIVLAALLAYNAADLLGLPGKLMDMIR
jgi:cysteine/O-acetylserine efflux protein